MRTVQFIALNFMFALIASCTSGPVTKPQTSPTFTIERIGESFDQSFIVDFNEIGETLLYAYGVQRFVLGGETRTGTSRLISPDGSQTVLSDVSNNQEGAFYTAIYDNGDLRGFSRENDEHIDFIQRADGEVIPFAKLCPPPEAHRGPVRLHISANGQHYISLLSFEDHFKIARCNPVTQLVTPIPDMPFDRHNMGQFHVANDGRVFVSGTITPAHDYLTWASPRPENWKTATQPGLMLDASDSGCLILMNGPLGDPFITRHCNGRMDVLPLRPAARAPYFQAEFINDRGEVLGYVPIDSKAADETGAKTLEELFEILNDTSQSNRTITDFDSGNTQLLIWTPETGFAPLPAIEADNPFEANLQAKALNNAGDVGASNNTWHDQDVAVIFRRD